MDPLHLVISAAGAPDTATEQSVKFIRDEKFRAELKAAAAEGKASYSPPGVTSHVKAQIEQFLEENPSADKQLVDAVARQIYSAIAEVPSGRTISVRAEVKISAHLQS